MLDIILVTVGKIKEADYADLASQYLKRLRPYVRLRLVELPATPFSSSSQEKAKVAEGKRITDFLAGQAGRKVYLLAERGRHFSSPELAVWLETNSPLTLVIGGALGFSPELYEKYPQLSLSPLTFPHEMARVILLEQIYRAATILKGKGYHY